MEWLTSIRKAIDYMEEHLEDNISAQDVADQVFMSSFFFQKGFSLMTGYGLGEYIRNRRLYLAALDLQKSSVESAYCTIRSRSSRPGTSAQPAHAHAFPE